MLKGMLIAFFMILFSVTLIANSSPDFFRIHGPITDIAWNEIPVPAEPLKSEIPLPPPNTLLIMGTGIIGLIIYRKKYRDRK